MPPILTRFRRSDRGNVGIIFGALLLPLVLGAGAAVDYSRASDLLSGLQAATDATVLTLCQASPTVATSDLQTKALAGVQSYMKAVTVSVTSLQVANSPRVVTLKTAASYPTAFMKIVNQNTVAIAATSTCSAQETYFEIALVLDTTGSMSRTDSSGTSKLTSAKTAATNFVNYMFSTGAQAGHVKMSLVPFSTAVAVDPTIFKTASWIDTGAKSSLHWQNVTGASGQSFANRLSIFTKLKTINSNWDWAGCLESLPYPLNVQDGAPTAANPDSYFLPFFAPDEVGNATCTSNLDSYRCWDTGTNPDYVPANSYLDDGTSSTGSCQNDSSIQTRLTQACKYKSPTTSTPVVVKFAGPNWYCPSQPLDRLGTSQSTLLSDIASLTALGSTNIHEGFVWGWRTVSPTSVFASDAAVYGTLNTQKVIVLMTDGTNQWLSNSNATGKSNYSAYGYFKNPNGTAANGRLAPGDANPSSDDDARTAIDNLTLEACTNAKAKNVIIYTVGFSIPTDPIDAQGLQLLSSCSTGSGYNFVASTSNDLISAFDKIAKGIGQLRITR